MPTPKKPTTRRLKKRRTTASVGGISQSAFAGYAHNSANHPSNRAGSKAEQTGQAAGSDQLDEDEETKED